MTDQEYDRQEFGAHVQHYRELRGWSQDELGIRIGKTSSNVSRIESGKQNCSVPDIKAIARALEVHVSQLFGEDDAKYLGASTDEKYGVMMRFTERIREEVNRLDAALAS